MNILDTTLADVKIIEPTVFGDERGFFYESFNQQQFDTAIGTRVNFVQDNHSRSTQGVLRGLHFQRAPHAQGKLVRVIQGEVFDVAVDIRPDSPTFAHWHAERLSAENKYQMWIPEGFAHGFVVLSPQADLLYKTTAYWHPNFEVTVRWDDPFIGIEWPNQSNKKILSKKDSTGIELLQLISDC